MWGKVSCLRKQHDGRDWASNHRPLDLKTNAPTTTPLCLHSQKLGRGQKDFHLAACLFPAHTSVVLGKEMTATVQASLRKPH